MNTTDKDEAWLIHSRQASLYALADWQQIRAVPEKNRIPRVDGNQFFSGKGRGSYTAHFRRVYWPDSTHIPGWVVSVLSFCSGVSVGLTTLTI